MKRKLFKIQNLYNMYYQSDVRVSTFEPKRKLSFEKVTFSTHLDPLPFNTNSFSSFLRKIKVLLIWHFLRAIYWGKTDPVVNSRIFDHDRSFHINGVGFVTKGKQRLAFWYLSCPLVVPFLCQHLSKSDTAISIAQRRPTVFKKNCRSIQK